MDEYMKLIYFCMLENAEVITWFGKVVCAKSHSCNKIMKFNKHNLSRRIYMNNYGKEEIIEELKKELLIEKLAGLTK